MKKGIVFIREVDEKGQQIGTLLADREVWAVVAWVTIVVNALVVLLFISPLAFIAAILVYYVGYKFHVARGLTGSLVVIVIVGGVMVS